MDTIRCACPGRVAGIVHTDFGVAVGAQPGPAATDRVDDDTDGAEKPRRGRMRPKTAYVFHVSQTDPIEKPQAA